MNKRINGPASTRRSSANVLCAAIALGAVMAAPAGVASAGTVTVSGGFTSFTSWMFDPSERESLVNGTALSSSGVVVGTNGAIDYFQSNAVSFATPQSHVDFRYGGAAFDIPRLLNAFDYTAPAAVDVALGDPLSLGTFAFTNGAWYPEAELGFELRTASSDPTLDGHVYNGTVRLISNSTDGSDVYAEADYFYFVEQPALGSARVFDFLFQPPSNPGNVGSFDLTGFISSIHLTDLDAVRGGGFTDSSTLPALADPHGTPVPAPETGGMLLAGVAGLLALRRRLAA